MPEEEKKNEPMVDIDTSGPEVEVNLEQETKQEEPKETLQVEETEPKQETRKAKPITRRSELETEKHVGSDKNEKRQNPLTDCMQQEGP